MNACEPLALYVDDDRNDFLIFGATCRRLGLRMNLVAVSDGERAVAYLEGAGGYADRERFPLPSLLILDLKMPRKSGFDVLEWLVRKHEFDSLPRIVLTGSDNAGDRKRALALGATDYFVKPCDARDLAPFVQRIYGRYLAARPEVRLGH